MVTSNSLANSEYDISDKVISIVADKLKRDKNTVTAESKLVDDLGADSLDQVELSLAVEEEFDIEIPEDKASNITKVNDIIQLVISLKSPSDDSK